MDNYEFTISTTGGKGTETPNDIASLLDENQLEEYIAHVVQGLVHQGYHQTYHERPVGETTATRIAHEILALMQHCGKDVSGFSFRKFHELINLNKYKRH